jgi:hypothetical protein
MELTLFCVGQERLSLASFVTNAHEFDLGT